MKSYKYVFALLLSLSCLTGLLGQTNKKTLNYQAVILDPKAIDIPGASIVGQPLNKGKVCLRFSLLNAQGGLDYEETQQVTTDEYGLVNVAIGTGSQAQASNSTSIYKSFESVVWNSSVKSLKVSVSYDGCSSFKQVSAQALNYTPYALYAEAVDYKNVREAPTKLSQFSNDAGYLILKDLDPLKSDIQTNSSKIEVANKSIADNKQASDATFLVVNQSISSLDTQVAANTTAIKENTGSISNINTKITDQQNQISDNRNQITATNNNLNTQIGGLQGQLNTTNSTVNSLSGVAEVVSNKSTAVDLGGTNPSDQAYPSQKAAKAYVDQVVSQIATTGVPDATTLAAGKVKLAGDLGGEAASPTVPALATKENTANKSTDVQADGNDNTKYPSVKAVKNYVDQAVNGTALAADLANKANLASPEFTGTPKAPNPASSDNSNQIATTAFVQVATAGIALQTAVDGKADKISPTFTGTPTAPTPTLGDNSTKLATTAYVDAQVSAGAADATTTSKGIVRLTGDLGGTATSPTVPGLALKANTADVTTSLALKEDISNKSNAALGTSITLYPTQSAVKTYVDAKVASATIADADASTKGKVQLTGDLGGTASSPTVPGLTAKANIASPTFTGTVTSPIYASAPQYLTDAATISWNPADGLNANVTLGGNRTLSFSSTPASGSYGTLVVTQDGTGSRTLTLPSGTNKVLGSASTTTIALSTAAGAKDILNFYYDGLTSTYYWNVGQGYGTAATAATVNLATGVTGTLAVANGGTGASALTANNVLLGNGANALQVVAPGASGNVLTSNGTTWSSSAPQNSANTISGVVSIANGGTGATSATDARTLLGAAPLASPTFTGTPAAPTASAGTSTTQVATTEFVTGAIATTTIPDATTLAKGKIQLAGDLSGTAALPVVASNAITTSKILDANVTDAKIATVSGSKVTGNITGSAANVTGTVAVANGGTGASSKTTAFDALSPLTTAGDLIYGGTNGTGARLGKGNNGTVLTMENNIPTWLTSIRATAGSTYNAAVGFSFLGGDWARNTGMFSDNPDGGGAATLKFRIATSNSTADPYLEISPSKVSVSPTTASTSKTTGALTVAGGLGVTENIYASNLNTSGTITSGAVTYPIAHGTSGQMLTTTGSGTLSWTTPAAAGVPYTGATGPVNLGTTYNLTVSNFTIGQGKTPASGDNLAIGKTALNNTTADGWPNIGLGSNSLNQTTNGKYNIGLGLNALYANTTGSNNIGIGFEAGRNASTSSNITAVGMEALKYESGAGNTAIGSYAGKPSTNVVYSGTTYSTFIGHNTTTGKTAEQTITNATAIGYGATVSASDKIQLGNTSVTNVATSGTLTAGDVTYPKTHGTVNQVLITSGSGSLSWASISAGTAITITNSGGVMTIAAAVRPMTNEFSASSGQAVFTLTQTPLNSIIWMFVNGIRIKNGAYAVSGTTVTYTASNNNSYTLVAGDRVQFDYAY